MVTLSLMFLLLDKNFIGFVRHLLSYKKK